MNRIIVFCEENNGKITKTSLELISKAFELSKKANVVNNTQYIINAVCVADCIADMEQNRAFECGAENFILVKNSNIINHSKDLIKQCFLDYYKKAPAEIILFPATVTGRQIAPLITSNLDCGLVADCIDLDLIVKNEKLILSATRPTFGAELMAEIISKKVPQCATIRPSIFSTQKNKDQSGNFEIFECDNKTTKFVKLLNTIPFNINELEGYDNVDVVLCAGYGIATADGIYFEKLKKISEKMGVKLACTRKVVDYKYLSSKYQIGLTGFNMKSNLYVGFGVSGALQHMCCAKNANKIVAINTDSDAEIFKYADYKIVSCAKSLIDELCEKV